MRRPVRRSRLLVLASLVTLVAGSVLTTAPAVLSAEPPTAGSTKAIKSMSDVQAGSRGSVDVSKLSGSCRIALIAAPASVPEDSVQGHAGRTRERTGRRRDVGRDPACPGHARATDPDATGPAWDGFSFADSDRQPPDPWVAVGPDHVVQTVNTVIQIFDRVGTVEVPQTEIGIPELFNLPPGYGNSDPRVVYDSLHGRWIGTEVSWTCDGDGDGTSDDPIGYIDFIVSRTADPTGIWDLFYWGFLGQLPDFPSAGTSTDKVGFTGNLFTLAPNATCDAALDYAGSAVVVLDWS